MNNFLVLIMQVNAQLEGRKKWAKKDSGDTLILQSRESSDPTNSLWNEKPGFNKCIVWCDRYDENKAREM